MSLGRCPYHERDPGAGSSGPDTEAAIEGIGRAAEPGTKRVFFHVGAPKTGTTYLQQVLFQNKALLADNGVLYPYDDFGQSFRSMQDFRGAGWGQKGASAYAGEWAAVAARTRDWTGPTVIISNELLGGSDRARIAAGVDSVQPAEVHVVFSARDFARQLVSDWQEHIKHKHTVTLEQFVDDLIEQGLDAPAPFGELFWGMHDAAYVLARWSPEVPVGNIHVITVPQAGGPRDALWQRFCRVTGLDADRYETRTPRSNPSMGVAETELVRRMNTEARKIRDEDYDPLVRIVLAERILGARGPKLTLPPGRMDWVQQRSGQLLEEVRAAGYHVEGDLADLLPDEAAHAAYVSPTGLTDADLAPAAIQAATGLLRHASHLRGRIREQEHALEGPPVLVPTYRDRLRGLHWRGRGRAGQLLRRARRLRPGGGSGRRTV